MAERTPNADDVHIMMDQIAEGEHRELQIANRLSGGALRGFSMGFMLSSLLLLTFMFALASFESPADLGIAYGIIALIAFEAVKVLIWFLEGRLQRDQREADTQAIHFRAEAERRRAAIRDRHQR